MRFVVLQHYSLYNKPEQKFDMPKLVAMQNSCTYAIIGVLCLILAGSKLADAQQQTVSNLGEDGCAEFCATIPVAVWSTVPDCNGCMTMMTPPPAPASPPMTTVTTPPQAVTTPQAYADAVAECALYCSNVPPGVWGLVPQCQQCTTNDLVTLVITTTPPPSHNIC